MKRSTQWLVAALFALGITEAAFIGYRAAQIQALHAARCEPGLFEYARR